MVPHAYGVMANQHATSELGPWCICNMPWEVRCTGLRVGIGGVNMVQEWGKIGITSTSAKNTQN